MAFSVKNKLKQTTSVYVRVVRRKSNLDARSRDCRWREKRPVHDASPRMINALLAECQSAFNGVTAWLISHSCSLYGSFECASAYLWLFFEDKVQNKSQRPLLVVEETIFSKCGVRFSRAAYSDASCSSDCCRRRREESHRRR